MALQLIDLGNEVEVVEIDTSKVPYTFSVKLTDKTYTFTVKYCLLYTSPSPRD